MTRVKICGAVHAADRDAALSAGADAVGVVSGVTVDTPREVDRATAREILAGVPPLSTAVLVTMPSSVQEAVRAVDYVRPDAVQVHGTLDPDQIGALGRRVRCRVVAAVDAADPALEEYAEAADAVLVDALSAEGGGGTGETLDWERTADAVADLDAPVILAGGLTPDNVGGAIRTVEPDGVDVATGVERATIEDDAAADDGRPGRKDPAAVRGFVANARRASREVPA